MKDEGSPDALLVERAAAGDRAAWEVLYRRHRDFVYRVACRFLGHPDDAKDMVQEVFVSVFRHAARWRDEASFRTYLFRVTANRCLNHRRRAWREVSFAEGGDPPMTRMTDSSCRDPVCDAASRETLARLRAAFERLPDRARLAVILVCIEGLRYREAAEAMGCTVSALESLLVRARRQLQEAVGEP